MSRCGACRWSTDYEPARWSRRRRRRTTRPAIPGAITAALFLQPFTGGLPWAHLDIAGPGRAARDAGIFSQGATGFGARLLARWVESLA